MWPEFWAALALAALLLVAPGAIALRALGMRPAHALALSPLFSVAAYGVTAVALGVMGVPASTPLVVAPSLAVALALAVWSALRGPVARCPRVGCGIVSCHELVTLAAYVLMGLVGTGVMLVANLGEADSFVQAWDNVAHFNLIRSMSDSGTWSTLLTSYYPDGAAAASPFPSDPHFYPNAWHLVAVMLVDALGAPVTLAANVTNAVASAVVFPLGVWALLSRVFSRRPGAVLPGAFVCLAFSSFPWNLIPRWTLYPILFSLALLPATMAAFMQLTARAARPRSRALAGAAFLAGGVSLALAQPSSVFSAAVFLAPWCVRRVFEWRRDAGSNRARAVAWACGFAALVVVVWTACLLAPFMRSVGSYFWPPICSFEDAVDYVLNLTFCDHTERPVLVAIVAVGLVRTLLSRRERWLLVPFGFSVVAFVVAASGEDTLLKHAISGFWYTDPYRVAAMAVIFCVPIAALGVLTMAQLVRRALRLVPGSASRATALASRATLPVVCALAALGLFAPAVCARAGLPQPWENDDFAILAWQLGDKSNNSMRLGYDAAKQDFVERVLELVGPEELVLNMPYDGSVYAYGVSGLNVYYRNMDGYGEASAALAQSNEKDAPVLESDESEALRTGLSLMLDGTHERTLRALEAYDIEYLLILERDDAAIKDAFYPYVSWRWQGMMDVDDQTPGFEVVLAEGDMRLYRIVGQQ